MDLKRNIEKHFEKLNFAYMQNELHIYSSHLTNEKHVRENARIKDLDRINKELHKLDENGNQIKNAVASMEGTLPRPSQPEDVKPGLFEIPSIPAFLDCELETPMKG